MVQQLTACMVSVPGGTNIDYRCPVTGEPVQTMRKRQYLLDKHGMVDARDLHSTWQRKEAEHKREQAELKAFNDKIPEAVRKQAQATVANPPAGA